MKFKIWLKDNGWALILIVSVVMGVILLLMSKGVI